MKTINLTQNGQLAIHARKGFAIKLILNEVPEVGYTYKLEVKNDRETVALSIDGVTETGSVYFLDLTFNIPTGPYSYSIVVTKTSNGSKRNPLSGPLIVLP